MEVVDGNEIMLISNKGTLVRTRVNEVSMVGRNTQGVRLIRTGDDEQVVGLQRIDEVDEEDLEAAVVEGEVAEVADDNQASDNAEANDESDL